MAEKYIFSSHKRS